MNSNCNFDWFAKKNSEFTGVDKTTIPKKKDIIPAEIKKLKDEIDKETNFFYVKRKLISSLYFGKKIEEGTPAEKFKRTEILNFDTFSSLFALFTSSEARNSATLPLYSVFLQFIFSLATPYISKDDESFYWPENSVKKDKVFKAPMISGSTWKGNLRWTAGKLLEAELDNSERVKKRLQIIKLFGSENASEKAYFNGIIPENVLNEFKDKPENKDTLKGRLNFYPTFFKEISLEAINPHDRKTKAGTIPVYIESVPADADGTFSLLYVPFDLMGRSNASIEQEAKSDIHFIAETLEKLMLEYGICAKKSSGFGIVNKNFIVKNGNPAGQLKSKNKAVPFVNFNEMKQQIDEVFSIDE